MVQNSKLIQVAQHYFGKPLNRGSLFKPVRIVVCRAPSTPEPFDINWCHDEFVFEMVEKQ